MKQNQLQLININRIQADQHDWKYHMHANHHVLEIMVVCSGSGNLYTSSMILPFHKGQIVVINPDISYGMSSDNNHPITVISFHYKANNNEFPNDFIIKNEYNPIIQVKEYEELLILLSQSTYELNHTQTYHNLCQSYLQSIFEIFRILIPTSQKIKVTYGQKTMKDIMDYLDSHYTEKINIHALGDKFGMDPSYMMRRFKKISGVTINTYITNSRIGHAQHLLQTTNKSFNQIAFECGFDTVQYFHTVFKKTTGMTPSQYKKTILT